MGASELIIRGRRVVLSGSVAPASIHIHDGLISAIGAFDEVSDASEVVTADEDAVVMPGLVDTHVHINSPGRTEWEGFRTATLAAAAGGVTTLVDMPLNSIPPTTTVAALQTKVNEARNKCYVDVGFWGAVIPGNTSELAGLSAAGVVGFKCFLVSSGVEEFPRVTETDLRNAMPELTRLNALLIVHAELPEPIEQSVSDQQSRKVDPTSYQTFLQSRPKAAENEAVELMIRLSREFGTRVHIVHLSSAEALKMIRDARSTGVNITVETCPHYLHFAAENIRNGATEFKCCPPIREKENREQLWEGLAARTIDIIVSDHSPCPPEMKLRDAGDFLAAWGGIASLQLRLPVVWTEASQRGFSFEDVVEWLCFGPARLVGLPQKGQLMPGCDADVVIFSFKKDFLVDPEVLQHRHKITPYAGEMLKGQVEKTFLRGRKIYDGGSIHGKIAGQLIFK